ncbi:IS701 family transposase [Pseudonocardia lacus]|uniref:IS701 family transposase n=1 Tax=Pseudonocardia lacus TaxID=2835865 RepID=UPI001BDCDA3B|nr:IS701 family transposase [Pseudonocardia lacus]
MRTQFLGRVAGRFARVETRRRFARFLDGMLAELPVKNCWTIAEHAGDPSPDGMQHLLGRARWDTDGLAEDLRGFVVEHLGEPDAVLIIDESGDAKKGDRTVGVQRQYSGTTGRVENVQVAVYLAYASRAGHAIIDRELYLPRSWADDPDRREAAGVPDSVEFATKPALAAKMIDQAVGGETPARWVTGDEVYGADPDLRACLEEHQLGYVLGVGCNRRVLVHGGDGGVRMRVDQIAAGLPEHCWTRYSAGVGAKGPRVYQWAFVVLHPHDGPGHRWLLIRRHPEHGELAYYRCYSPHPVPLTELVRVGGVRWRIEESFQATKTLTGLDEHQVRRWSSWRRWTLIAILAHALLAATAAATRTHHHDPPPESVGLIPLSCNEIARLINRLTVPARSLTSVLRWSLWRRRHQFRARRCHYQRRQEQDHDLRL